MPCTVDAWLKSPEFTELQLLEFYYSLGNHLPDTESHLPVPSAPMSISRFSSSLHTATFVLCSLTYNLLLNLRLLSWETTATYGSRGPLAGSVGGRCVAQRADERGAAQQRSRRHFYPGSGRGEA